MVQVIKLKLEKIKETGYAMRVAMDEEALQELTSSISRLGVIVPITVTKVLDGYMVVAGHRRVAASRIAGLLEVPAIISDVDEAKTKEIAFAENFFRKDLTPVELAAAIKDCIDGETMTIQTVAAGFHRSEDWVRRMLNLLSWPEEVLQEVHAGVLSISAAANIAQIPDESYRQFLLRNAHDSGATARVTAAWLQAYNSMQPPEKAILAEPVAQGQPAMPMVPQAPCLCCSQVYRTDELSHVPVCASCIQSIRNAQSVSG